MKSQRQTMNVEEYRATQTHDDFMNQVVQLATTLGYKKIYHTHDSRRSEKGFPDLVLVNPEKKRVVYIEIKRENDKPTPEQEDWILTLKAAGQDAYIFRPSDWEDVKFVLSWSNN